MIPVTVSKIRQEAQDIRSFELTARSGKLPPYAPGAHIEMFLTDEIARCYSLCGNEPGRYLIAVKREPNSSGGSRFLHEEVQEGDDLAISEPRDRFPLHSTAEPALLIGGGIGITPLLAMAYALKAVGREFHMHYFARSESATAFYDVLQNGELAGRCDFHFGLPPAAVDTRMMACLAAAPASAQAYVCGPGPFIDTAIALATRTRPDLVVRFERFSGTGPSADAETLELVLAKSQRTITVPSDKTILEVLEAEGLAPNATCRQGYCGSCLVGVLAGQPDHKDDILTEEEKAAGREMCICVSRAKSGSLTLDL